MSKHTDITFILDRSGSMESIKEATIIGFNSFLKEHKSANSETKITLIQFDNEYDMVYDGINIKEVNYLNNKTYMPRGTTALLDAIGKTINHNKRKFKEMPDNEKPKNVIVVVLTDGYENNSRLFSRKEIFMKINKRRNKDNWVFLFIGANQDAIIEGTKIGISDDLCLSIRASKSGIKHAFDSVVKQSKYMLKDGYVPKFSQRDRDNQLN